MQALVCVPLGPFFPTAPFLQTRAHPGPPPTGSPNTQATEPDMAKQMVFQSDARDAIKSGVQKLAKAVTSTLGPRGRNAILDKGWGAPTVTKDGVTVAEEIELSDPYERMGAALVKEVASKTSDKAGDGTTTATLLTEAIFTQGLRAITAGHSPNLLNAGLRAGCDAIVKELERVARPIKDNAEIRQVATISANNNPSVGERISKADRKSVV